MNPRADASMDLVVVVPCKAIEQAMDGILSQHHKLGIRPIHPKLLTHPQRDPGCYREGPAFLKPYARQPAVRGLVVFDRAWDGAPGKNAEDLRKDVERRLAPDWGARAGCVVIDPEVEVWAFSDSPAVEEQVGWRGRTPGLRMWLEGQGLWPADRPKPADPKAALDKALRVARIKPSASRAAPIRASRT